jgi:hypothetical protein
MIWFEATDSIYIFHPDGRWQQVEDRYSEDQPENDPTIVPPTGYYQPVRGFGKVWRENPLLRAELGWAISHELGYESALQWQEVDGGGLTTLFMRAFNGRTLGLTYRSADGGDWVVASS